ncbi:MAG: hypothetical protein H0X41_00080, partial [Chitinophagaceae bacterium]|nr:hypothetical protein [Chitinophagaceae bacterium]
MKKTSIEKIVNEKLVMIGNGPTGFKFCEKYVKYRLEKKFTLVVYGEENHPAYDRINLTRYFSVESPEQLYMAPLNW